MQSRYSEEFETAVEIDLRETDQLWPSDLTSLVRLKDKRSAENGLSYLEHRISYRIFLCGSISSWFVDTCVARQTVAIREWSETELNWMIVFNVANVLIYFIGWCFVFHVIEDRIITIFSRVLCVIERRMFDIENVQQTTIVRLSIVPLSSKCLLSYFHRQTCLVACIVQIQYAGSRTR